MRQFVIQLKIYMFFTAVYLGYVGNMSGVSRGYVADMYLVFFGRIKGFFLAHDYVDNFFIFVEI